MSEDAREKLLREGLEGGAAEAEAPSFPALSFNDLELAGGELRFGPYQLVEKIAGGGMAEIFRVYHAARPNEPLALKLIRSDKSDDGAFQKMLVDEARIAGMLRHPNIARVLGLHEAHGQLGLVLEFVDGIDLIQAQAVLRERHARFPLMVAVHVLVELLDGLDFAHEVRDEAGEPLHVVHRDVSPGNVMIDVRGHVRIVDWGIARAKDRGSGTDAGQVKGKFRYMAPEQITGGVAGPHTDVYAAAVTFWELLAGKRVYDELDVPQLMMVVSKGQAPPLRDARRDVPDALVAVYERATASSLERRFRTARQAAEAFRACGVAIDRELARQRLAQLPMAARLIDRRRGYERAVLLAKSAATEGDLEDAVLRALEEPDRVERLEVDRDAVADAERLRAAERGPRR